MNPTSSNPTFSAADRERILAGCFRRVDATSSAADSPFQRMSENPSHNRWSAFWLSLAAPGAGHLLAGSGWCFFWFAAAALIVAASTWLPADPLVPRVQFVAAVCLGLLSAEHAKRAFENRVYPRGSGVVRKEVRSRRPRGQALDSRIELVIACPARVLWKKIADVERFLLIDPFHVSFHVAGGIARGGAECLIEHRAFGCRFFRRGRFLWWRPEKGYAFSDLSARGCKRGFPHVFFVTVDALDSQQCRLRIHVRGRWRSRWIPPWLGRWWVHYVSREHARLLARVL
ncbi:MAG: hypothetical protein N2C14_03705 [Planctomycetales bacterium]